MPAVAEQNKERAAQSAPVLKKSVLLRCMAYRLSDGRYVAECIDLDLMVTGIRPILRLRACTSRSVDTLRSCCRVTTPACFRDGLPSPTGLDITGIAFWQRSAWTEAFGL